MDSLQCADRRGRWHTPFERVGFRGGHAARCSALACETRVDGAKPGFVTSRERALTFFNAAFRHVVADSVRAYVCRSELTFSEWGPSAGITKSMHRRSLTPLILAFSRTHVETQNLLDASVAIPLNEAQVTRRVTQSTLANLALAVGVLSGVSMLRSQPDMQGWLAAAGAALVFGGSSLPAKHPAAAAAGTLGFQLWVTIGNSALNLMLLLLLNVPIQWSPYGVVGAAVLTGTQLFAWPAIQRLGAAVGPGIWCGIGMLTSFLWGVLVFHEPFKTPALAVMALVMLVGGVGGVASSQVLNHRDASNQSPPPSQLPPLSPAAEELDGSGTSAVVSVPAAEELDGSGTSAMVSVPAAEELDGSGMSAVVSVSAPLALPLERPTEPRSALVIGVACALGTGLLDGSLMAPFSSFKTSGLALGDQVALRYLGGFALALPVVALLPLLLALLVEHLRQGARSTRRLLPLDGRSPRRFLNLSCALSGMSCGALWAAGNVLSVHASMRLGQAVGFPLTQVCVVISALWGILFFGELPQPRARALFASSSVVVLAGAVALKASGGGIL